MFPSLLAFLVFAGSAQTDPPLIVKGKIPERRVAITYGPYLTNTSNGPSPESLIRYGNPWKVEIQYTGNKVNSEHVPSSKALGIRTTGARHAVPQYPGGRFNGSRCAVARPKVRYELPYRNRGD